MRWKQSRQSSQKPESSSGGLTLTPSARRTSDSVASLYSLRSTPGQGVATSVTAPIAPSHNGSRRNTVQFIQRSQARHHPPAAVPATYTASDGTSASAGAPSFGYLSSPR